ncbi:hypothetical protein [Limnofasciculus baicalensis]|uniref:Uncharacterized protein n=1 Tax=Limnofasciculus baicalensis BBK-W-15 TaxID=2699891 RepID=A0AAE3GWE7_9CYAN|nr:hypothetical protein [Limnofasciculus baicalensis]MCP2731136.1 hypothetical protein [Limnofasciculus baicalensis BBK-W-15]
MMNFTGLSLSLLSITSFLTVGSTFVNPVSAQNVQADIGLQYRINGSQQPTNRNDDVQFNSQGSCMGNASVTIGVQGIVGGNNPGEQNRHVRHEMTCNSSNGTGINPPRVQLQPSVGIDVYNPADNFRN